MRHLIRVMSSHDLTEKKTKTFREHPQRAVLETCDLRLDSLITFLTIENNNINIYIVTLEERVMVTAFEILGIGRGKIDHAQFYILECMPLVF